MDQREESKMNIKEIRNKTGLSQKKFGEKFGIPTRTIESWESGERETSEYVLDLLNKAVEDEQLIPMACVFERYLDKAGHGETKIFNDPEKAIQYAKEEWSSLSEADQKRFIIDPAPRFDVSFRRMMWDDISEEWTVDPDEDPMQIVWNALEG